MTLQLKSDDTIIAQCTARGPAALALIRITGPDAFWYGNQISRLASCKKITECTSHTIEYGCVVDKDGTVIDRVLFLIMQGPRTFTGYDTLEITCHNNQAIIDAIISTAVACGIRYAQPGEFSRYAFLNNKCDLLQVEAINELIHAQTQQGLRQSLAQVEGTLSAFIDALEKDLLKAYALSEASFEFIDDEIEFHESLFFIINQVRNRIQGLISSFYYQQRMRSGARIVLVGAVNAGKSSLFNILIGHERAIVSQEAGTTRDTIEATFSYQGITWTLVDTAGLRCTVSPIEQSGIERSFHEAAISDIILLAHDVSRVLDDNECSFYKNLYKKYNDKIVLIGTKIDQEQHHHYWDKEPDLFVSSYAHQGIDQLREAIAIKVKKLFTDTACPFLLNERHRYILERLDNQLASLETLFKNNCPYELVSYHLTQALADCSELTGKSITEKGLDTIFREFCVGK